ncbi:MAG: ATP-binding cassette domain-containing protein [Nitriliruptorales bacterium]|nr:ATP-binding cassette domain-containing protein [Nitriliruptorales bacterium]
MAALLEIDGLSAGYGIGPNILNDISLAVEPGRTYCVIGPNGAGKSTMLKVIAGLLKPRSGRVVLKGTVLNRLRPDQILAHGCCFVPQEPSLFADMTVRENLRMGAFLERDRRVVEQRMQRVFDLFPELADHPSQRAGTLSGGQQQMVTLGRALMVEPELLMIDEPSLGLAPKVSEQIFDTIGRLGRTGIAILLVEQNVRKGLECSDWSCVLDLGTKRFEGPAERILSDPRIRELYLGKQLRARPAAAGETADQRPAGEGRPWGNGEHQ